MDTKRDKTDKRRETNRLEIEGKKEGKTNENKRKVEKKMRTRYEE
jgi:hypothetical protein